MDEKLNIITEKLYNDGVVKAKEEAERIIQEAELKAKGIIETANKKSVDIITSANKKSVDMKHKLEAELRLGGEQAIAAIKQRIINIISGEISFEISNEAFKDISFVENLILTVADKWKNSEGVYDLNLILTEDMKKDTEAFFAAKGKSLLDKGMNIDFVGKGVSGFVLKPKDGSYQINFTDEVFHNFFADYLRGYTKKLLFEN
jgi:V/A-type H+-transporting ATPase subunit E